MLAPHMEPKAPRAGPVVELIPSQQGWGKQTGSAPSLRRCEAEGHGEGQGTAGLALTQLVLSTQDEERGVL